MEKERNSKLIGMVALIISVISMTVGFAAFSRVLTITPEADTLLNKSGDLNVVFEKYDNTDEIKITPTGTLGPLNAPASGILTPESEGSSIFQNSHTSGENVANPLIEGLKARFTNKGQSVKFQFYVKNDSAYKAYRKQVIFSGNTSCECVPNDDENGSCTQGELITDEGGACDAISMKISFGTVGNETASGSYETSDDNINGMYLESGAKELVTIEITYANDSHVLPINDFTVKLPSISLKYSTVS